jgi:hypothetical protein
MFSFERVADMAVRFAMLLALTRVSRADELVTLVKDGVPHLPIASGSTPQPAEEVRRYLEAISGTRLETVAVRERQPAIYVGVAADFPWKRWEKLDDLGREGFVIQSDGQSLYLVGREEPGVRHAVATFLHSLGCRWFFPGSNWEVIPKNNTIAGAWNERQTPRFALQRKIWYGFGASPTCARDLADWERHNRMGGPIAITIGHTWHGLDPQRDFEKHPEWFAGLLIPNPE